MKFLENAEWEEVFEKWREREAEDPGWVQCATQVKGWPDWETWRRFSAEQLGASDLKWERYLVADPLAELPEFLIGPFQGWQNRLGSPQATSFADMMKDPVQSDFFAGHSKVRSMMEQFPGPTELIAVLREDLGKVVCIEGHHRSAAAALARVMNQPISFTGPVTVALAHLPTEKAHVLEEMLKRGSHKL